MCGIFGYFDVPKRPISEQVIAAMGRAIAHRGPDDFGIFHDARAAVAIGNNRLAIIDVSHGHQPFVSDDGDIVLVQNGAIFNYPELTKELAQRGFVCRTSCDTEVLLRLYEADGIDFVSRLNGMFAIAIYDRREDAVYLIRDRLGEKPLHYSFRDGRLLFGSEIKAILPALDTPGVDELALFEYLTFNYVPPPRTMFEGVQHVMPGTWLRFDRLGARSQAWWRLGDVQPVVRSDEEYIELINEVLDDAVRIRLRADVPYGAFLSGGIDSSTVVGLMARHIPGKVRTFSIGFDDPRFDESRFSSAAALRFGTTHVLEVVEPDMFLNWPMTIRHCDQPHGDVSFLPMHRVAELASRHVKMVLTGDGADELFAGYEKYEAYFATRDSPRVRQLDATYLDAICLFHQREMGQLLTDGFRRRLGDVDCYASVVHPLLEESSHMDPINQSLFIDSRLLLPGNNLVKPDRMGMAVSIENRAPFLDHRMIELAFSIPGTRKLAGGETKHILKKAVAPLIGDDLAYRAKQMFTVPVGEWLRTHMFPQAREMLLSERCTDRGFLEPAFVERMLFDHRDGSVNRTREIRALMALEIWFRVFIDGGQ